MESGLTVIMAPSGRAVREATDRLVGQLGRRCARVARLLPNARLASLTQRRLADAGLPTLGIDVATLDAWALGRWEVFGDGRVAVRPEQRRAIALRALALTPTRLLNAGARGLVGCVEAAVRKAAGLAEFDSPDTARLGGLSDAQRELLEVCRTYERLLADHGLIEPSQAMALLPGVMGEAGWAHLVLEDASSIACAQRPLLLEAARRAGVTLVVRAGEPNARDDEAGPATRTGAAGACPASASAFHPGYALAQDGVCALADLCEEQGIPVAWERAPEADGAPRAEELALLARAVFQPSCDRQVPATGAVRFVMPSGGYAQPEALAQQIALLHERDGIACRQIVVTCKDPLKTAEGLAERLATRGMSCLAQGSVPLPLTHVGSALIGLARLACQAQQGDGPAATIRACASDLARNPLLGIPARDALRLDRHWRQRRLAGARDMLEGLCEASPIARGVVDAICAGDLARAAACLGERIPSGPLSPDLRTERAACDAAERMALAAREYGVSPSGPGRPAATACETIERLFEGARVRTSRLSVAATSLDAQRSAEVLSINPDAVRIVTLPEAQGLRARALVMCDLTADSYPLSESPSAADALLESLGLQARPDATDALRWQLMAALDATSDVLVLERPLADENARALRPSALLEELVDCYRADVTAPDDLVRSTGLPKRGTLRADAPAGLPHLDELPLARPLGEEAFAELLSPVGPLDRAVEPVEAPRLCLREQRSADLLAPDDMAMSPSGLEMLLRCPARWFFERRVPSNGIDAEFGPLQRGNFHHAVLRLFHERLQPELGIARVSPDAPAELLARIDALLDACFDQTVTDFEHAARGGDGQTSRGDDERAAGMLVATSALERQALESMRLSLRECVRRDALLPAGYVPVHNEWEFGRVDRGQQAVPYAGIRLHGTIDRIDADGQGGLLVIDYKGSLSTGYGPVADSVAATRAGAADGDARQADASGDQTDADDDPTATATDAPEGADPLPLHSQALMYAGALRRLGLAEGSRVSGALYLSYSSPTIKGFAEAGLVTPGRKDLLDEGCLVRPLPDGSSGLDALIDHVERSAAEAIGRLLDGDIEPNPRFGKLSCERCGVPNCPRKVC